MRDFSIKKLYYSISEVSKITEVEQYVLRYWETEFEGLNPQKNRAGNRAYTNKDIQLVLV
ncbi:MAG: MerR family transcriptional regulator, partial [Ignavibacteriales bacterium]|nr:MerR family transcriptional regulator [Ignavibacteriales bacterium]